MLFMPDVLVNLKNPAHRISLADCKNKKIIALCGIGNPDRFFHTLRSAGLTIKTRVFPDHYCFQPKDIDLDADVMMIMTEKDGIKCRQFADERHWVLEGSAVVDERLVQGIVSNHSVSQSLSSSDGSPSVGER